MRAFPVPPSPSLSRSLPRSLSLSRSLALPMARSLSLSLSFSLSLSLSLWPGRPSVSPCVRLSSVFPGLPAFLLAGNSQEVVNLFGLCFLAFYMTSRPMPVSLDDIQGMTISVAPNWKLKPTTSKIHPTCREPSTASQGMCLDHCLSWG